MERHNKIGRFKKLCGMTTRNRLAVDNKTEQKSQIVKELIKKGITQKRIASDIGVSAQTVGEVIAGKSRSRKIEEAITRITGYKFPPNARVPKYAMEEAK